MTAQPLHNRHSIRLLISALTTASIEGVIQDLDSLCADVIHTHTVDPAKYGEKISRLTDTQVHLIHS